MKFCELKKKSDSVFPALLLEILVPHKTRVVIRKVSFYILITTFFLSISGEIFSIFLNVPFVEILNIYAHNFRGLFFVTFVFWLILYFYELLYFSYYFKSEEMDFEVARIISKTTSEDITGGFLGTVMGKYSMKRLGINSSMIDRFLETRKHFVTDSEYEIILNKKTDSITLSEYGRTLVHFDVEFVQFLNKYGITPSMFVETLAWVSRTIKNVRRGEMWWSRDNLSRIPSIGRNWSFGEIYLLQKYGHSIYMEDSYISLGDKWRIYSEQVERLESILVKERGANVMLVVDETASGLDIVSSFARMIVTGKIHSALEHKRVFVFDPEILLEETSERSKFETLFKNILVQSANAGNVVLVIPHLHSFFESAHSMGVDVSVVLSDALRTSDLQIIGLTSGTGFSSTIEPHKDIMTYFTKVDIGDVDKNKVIEILEDEIYRIESLYNVFFTYPSIVAIVEGVKRFYPDELLSNKAYSTLYEIVPQVGASNNVIVSKDMVDAFFSSTTGVEQGPLSKKEQKELSKLEEKLHKRVIGQEPAIVALSNSLRRARTGLTNPKRPIGSFLFLGPTGVGKTETVKTLAETLFGDEEDMVRLDMSEFQGVDAVRKIIGTTSDVGILTLKVREKPYGVLLLDEFEKASRDVHNIFLQILDEGFFTNGMNEKIHLRNMVIVATSNAGSKEIFSLVEDTGKLPENIKETLIETLVSGEHFRPELINRFDDVIVFAPLFENDLRQVAEILIKRLNERMSQKGISIVINDVLKDYLIEVGTDQEFGARAMNRAIQDNVERLIADGIIGGNISNGDVIEFEVIDKHLHIKG